MLCQRRTCGIDSVKVFSSSICPSASPAPCLLDHCRQGHLTRVLRTVDCLCRQFWALMRLARRGASSKAAQKDQATEKAEALFEAYKDSDDDCIGPEGVEKLCSDLKVDPSSRKVLLLAWKMGASRMGYFSRQEFTTGLKLLNATSLDKLRKVLPKLDQDVDENEDAFSAFFAFAFKFCLMEPQQKILDIETAVQMLHVVLPEGNEHLGPFSRFLKEQTEYKYMNLDQWTSFYRFSEEVGVDCSNYDEGHAWPLLLDNYVEWLSARQSK